MAETLAQKAQRLGIKPQGATVARETLAQKAARLGIKPPSQQPYKVPALPPEDRQAKIARYQQEAQVAQAEAEKSKFTYGGFAKTLTKALPLAFGVNILNKEDKTTLKNAYNPLVENFAPLEVGLGDTISKVATDPTQYSNNVQKLSETQLQLQKLIRGRLPA